MEKGDKTDKPETHSEGRPPPGVSAGSMQIALPGETETAESEGGESPPSAQFSPLRSALHDLLDSFSLGRNVGGEDFPTIWRHQHIIFDADTAHVREVS